MTQINVKIDWRGATLNYCGPETDIAALRAALTFRDPVAFPPATADTPVDGAASDATESVRIELGKHHSYLCGYAGGGALAIKMDDEMQPRDVRAAMRGAKTAQLRMLAEELGIPVVEVVEPS